MLRLAIIILSLRELELEQLTRWSDITPKVEMWHVRAMSEGNVECIRGIYYLVRSFDYRWCRCMI